MLFTALALAASTATLEPLQFLVGHCWRTAAPDGSTQTNCFSSIDHGNGIRDRLSLRKDGQTFDLGESVIVVTTGGLRYAYDGQIGGHLEGPMHAADGKIIFDDVDKTGTETFWRQVDANHYEDVTVVLPGAPPELANAGERKLFELVPDENP